MRKNWVALILAASCGGMAGMAVDAGNGDSVAHGDAALTMVPVSCQPYTRTQTAADGSKVVTTYSYAKVPEIAIGDDFEVRSCGETRVPDPNACPQGSTCSGSMTPAGSACYEARNGGQFLDGHLLVYCGYDIKYYGTTGALTGTYTDAYAQITVSH